MWFAVHFPRLTAVTTAVLAGQAGIPVPSGPVVHRGVWRLSPFERGRQISTMLGENLHPNFPTIDRVVFAGTGALAKEISSIKSLDLTARTYQTTFAIFTRLVGYADDVANFQAERLVRVTVQAGRETKRILDVAIEPGIATFGQMLELQLTKLVVGMKGVQMNIHQVH